MTGKAYQMIDHDLTKEYLSITRPIVFLLFYIILIPHFSWAGYSYIEILPPGWQEAEAHDINNRGEVVGSGKDGRNSLKGFIFNKGIYKPLIPPGWEEAYANGINNNNDVIGYGLDDYYKGFLYRKGKYTEIIPPDWKEAYAYAINDKGAIVGYGRHRDHYKGFLFYKGTYFEILPPGWTEAFTFGINNSNIIVGYGRSDRGSYKGFLYNKGTYEELVPPGWTEAKAIDINDNGDVVGHGIKGTIKGFIYSKGNYKELTFPGVQFIELYGINNRKEIVGRVVQKDGNMKGFIYNGVSDTTLLPQGWKWAQTYAVNNSGSVIGFGSNGFYKRGLVASGRPEITVSSMIIFFGGYIKAGNLPDKTVTVKNSGTAELKIGTVTAPSSSYSIAADSCSGQMLLPSITCHITYRVVTTSEIPAVSNSYIPSNDPQKNRVTIMLGVFPDSDNDGYTIDVDCDDSDRLVNPDMSEILHNKKDDDCDPATKDE